MRRNCERVGEEGGKRKTLQSENQTTIFHQQIFLPKINIIILKNKSVCYEELLITLALNPDVKEDRKVSDCYY